MWLASVLRFWTMAASWNSSRASETSQTHSLEAMMDLQVGEAHLYFLALIARLLKLRGAL